MDKQQRTGTLGGLVLALGAVLVVVDEDLGLWVTILGFLIGLGALFMDPGRHDDSRTTVPVPPPEPAPTFPPPSARPPSTSVRSSSKRLIVRGANSSADNLVDATNPDGDVEVTDFNHHPREDR